ncbi:MAG: glycosyltransferase [Lentisphaeria bacterium]|nr:glycosyltransferase [Lentisphaeria bacterium]
MQDNLPMVSICCITFKHEKYIRECLDGFIMQKTNFPFEVIVHDDASPDKTADIIREYEAKYPDIIKPIYQTENQYSKKIKSLWKHVFPRCRGKYIAICEGDDFWCDENKLQMQYDFMEANPDYSLCMHGRYIIDYFTKQFIAAPFIKNFPEDSKEFAYRVACGETLYSTQTMFIRKSTFDAKHDEIFRDAQFAPMSDTQIAFHLGLAGKVKYIRKRMACYRIFSGSATHNAQGDNKQFIERARAAYNQMLENSGYTQWIEDREKALAAWDNFVQKPSLARRIASKIYHLIPNAIAENKYKSYMKSKEQK